MEIFCFVLMKTLKLKVLHNFNDPVVYFQSLKEQFVKLVKLALSLKLHLYAIAYHL